MSAAVGAKTTLGVVAEIFPFASKSNPANSYECLVYIDGTKSCNCPGWARRVGPGGLRECKHTMLIDQIAAREPQGAIAGAVIGAKNGKKVHITLAPAKPAQRRKFDFSE